MYTIGQVVLHFDDEYVCRREEEEEEQKVSLLALRNKMFIIFKCLMPTNILTFSSDCLNIEQIDSVHRHAHMYALVCLQ